MPALLLALSIPFSYFQSVLRSIAELDNGVNFSSTFSSQAAGFLEYKDEVTLGENPGESSSDKAISTFIYSFDA